MKANSKILGRILSCAFFLLMKGATGLKCYQCITLECTESALFCDSVKDYVLHQLPDLYYGYDGHTVSQCPNPTGDEEGWEELRKENVVDCDEEKAEEATCALGRFRITTQIYESGKNITSHGTALGCAKRALLKLMKQAADKNQCDMSRTQSKFIHSKRHYLEIEHCGRYPDVCHKTDFCIPSYAATVKEFIDDPPPKPFPFGLVLGIFLLIALAVIVLTFLAPFFNG